MSEKNFTVTAKTKLGTLVTVRGDTAEEFVSNVNSAYEKLMSNAVLDLEALAQFNPATPAEIQQAFNGTIISDVPATNFAPVPPPVTAAPVAPVAGDRSCPHGVMIKRSGSGQYGPYKGWFCPSPQGTPDQCKAVYAKKNTPEWNAF